MVFLDAADVRGDEATQRWLERVIPLDGSWTLQEYVKHPLLYRGRKFDMRVWAVITSIDPLRIFLLEHAFPKVQRGSRDALPSRTRVAASPRNRATAHSPCEHHVASTSHARD